ncbi:nucleotide sugar dehydrogenase [Myriangium duriaei CBS 260.36]|uniref:Nucleotide sugar dehydrogenase n=1 Tax=Myriangium duriaei CBS 260.36 TaxID=1168546 RepID=A0A9P4IX43_9PEZI|nr:nucleotide sugar dehydrogenase [Myriangium duriaei CBS 260.36]
MRSDSIFCEKTVSEQVLLTLPTRPFTIPDICVCVIGVGFVGESLVREFSTAYRTIGFDISSKRITQLRPAFNDRPNASLSADESVLAHGTHYLIAVPTLLGEDQAVDTTHLNSAIHTVLRYAKPGSTIVIESSVSVGTTRRLLGAYSDMHCGMSPERIDPGRISPAAYEIPKIVSGLTPQALDHIQQLYSRAFNKIVPVSSSEVAEMTKLYENCFRMVNIAYVNEISDACLSHGIDSGEVFSAAATKPFGFMPGFQKGLGVGGHCIPVNPFYLFENNPDLPVLRQATKRTLARPKRMATGFYALAKKQMRSSKMTKSKPRILVAGVAFKPGQSSVEQSPAAQFLNQLRRKGCSRLAFYDPLVRQRSVTYAEKLKTQHWTAKQIMEEFDAVAVCMKQEKMDLSVLEGLPESMVYRFV